MSTSTRQPRTGGSFFPVASRGNGKRAAPHGKPFQPVVNQFNGARNGKRPEVGGAKDAVSFMAVRGQGQRDPLAFDRALADPEQPSRAAHKGRLRHDPDHVALGLFEYRGGMQLLERRTAKAFSETQHGAIARKPGGEIATSAIIFERP